MGRRTRECYLCGLKYEYCGTCSNDRMKPSYMSEFHNGNCKDIFDICTRFNMQLMSKEEAKAALEKCDLSNKSNFKSYIKDDIKNIFAVPAEELLKPKRIKKAELNQVEEAVHEVVIIEENK